MTAAKFILLSALLLPAIVSNAQEGGDVQAQILYAFETEDSNSLVNLIQGLTTQVKNDAADNAAHYHLAHAQYRYGQLLRERKAHQAEAAFSACIDQLKPVLDKNGKSVEALALQSACYSELANLTSLETVLLRTLAADRLKAAAKLAPRNPRVVLLSALQDMRHAKPGSAERQHAFTELELAAQLFDESSATDLDSPGWGHAEAYLALGRELQARGDHLGARNWIEKALLAAPDYKVAQRQLALLAKP
jgi:tetratricopeptide (TPR) repeat protein